MSSSSSHSLTVEDLNRLLFNMDHYDNTFLDAAALSEHHTKPYQQPQQQQQQPQQPDQSALFASVIGDITPAAAAVLGESPAIDTPYLDPSMTPYTPYTPATTFTPALNDMQDSPHFSPCMDANDISMAQYLPIECSPAPNSSSWFAEPAAAAAAAAAAAVASSTPATFSGDPSQLMLDTCNGTPAAASSARLAWHDEPAAEASDMLFPPLDDDDDAAICNSSTNDNTHDLLSVFLGFDFSGADEQQYQQQYDQQQQQQSSSGDSGENTSSTQKENSQEVSQDSQEQQQAQDDQDQDKKQTTTSRKRRSADGATSSPDAKRRRATPAVSSTPMHTPSGESKRYECPVCQARFNRRYNLGTHVKTHDKNRKKEFECTVCPKSFDRRHDRDRHIATVHLGERSYACGRCQAAFSRKDALTRHIDQKHGVV